MTDFFNDCSDIDSHRAETNTTTTAGAQGLSEFVVVIFELVHDPVAVALGLKVTGVMTGSMVGELPETAGVPVLPPFTFLLGAFLHYVKAVAGGTDKSAGTAPDTAGGY